VEDAAPALASTVASYVEEAETGAREGIHIVCRNGEYGSSAVVAVDAAD
jgi:hypothetical protein